MIRAQATAAITPRAAGLVRLLVAGTAGALPPGRTGNIADVLFCVLKVRYALPYPTLPYAPCHASAATPPPPAGN